MKLMQLAGLTAAAVLMATGSFADGKTPSGAISQNVTSNGAFEDKGSYVTNGNVNFSDAGAMRSVNGKARDRASENSAVDTDDKRARGGTRVEPRGLFGN